MLPYHLRGRFACDGKVTLDNTHPVPVTSKIEPIWSDSLLQGRFPEAMALDQTASFQELDPMLWAAETRALSGNAGSSNAVIWKRRSD